MGSGTGGGPLAGASLPTSKGRHASLLQNNGNSSEEKLLHTVRAMISRMESLTDDLNDMQGKMSTIESRITGQVGLPKFDFVPVLNPPPAPTAAVAGGAVPNSPAASLLQSAPSP